jgi:hypothetical protein
MSLPYCTSTSEAKCPQVTRKLSCFLPKPVQLTMG